MKTTTTTIVTKKSFDGGRAILGVFESKALAKSYAKTLPKGSYAFVEGALNGLPVMQSDGTNR